MPEPHPFVEATSAAAAAVDRRAWVRYPCANDVACHPLTAGSRTIWSGKVQDLSTGGLGLVLDRRFDAGTELVVVLQGKETGASRRLRVRVVHDTLVTANPGLRWLVGCAFVCPFNDDEFRQLLSETA